MVNQLRTLLSVVCLFLANQASATTRYVDVNNATPAPPYTNWATAATNIQLAVDAAAQGDLILVTNGVYQTGGRVGPSSPLTNRIMVSKPMTIQSVNGPRVTSIVGYQVSGTTNGPSAVRCAYLTVGALLSGFTLTNGATLTTGSPGQEQSGGGVWLYSYNAVVSNCVITGNCAYGHGGGAAGGGTLDHCTVIGNSAPYAGGASQCYLNFCVVTGNQASLGGGAELSTLNDCLVISNTASTRAGGLYSSYVYNSTIVGNSAPDGGGADWGMHYNCILYYNTASTEPNYTRPANLANCCTTPAPSPDFQFNFTIPPLFVNPAGGDFHLQATSPCINAGVNSWVRLGTDFDGNPRISGYTVDVGAYEVQSPASIISYAWLQSVNLPVDGSADFIDSDGDGMNNWQEWRTGTDPKNSKSFLHMLSATNSPSGNTVTWQSAFNWNYFLERATDPGQPSAFQLIQSNINGGSGKTSFTDTNAPGPGPYFYRVGVQ